MVARTIYERNGVSTDDTAIDSEYMKNDDFEIDFIDVQVLNTFTAKAGDIVTFKSGTGYNIFEGILERILPKTPHKILRIYSYEQQLNQDIIEEVFVSQTFDTLVGNLISTYSDLTFINNTGQNPTIDEFSSRNKTPWQIIKDNMKKLLGVTYTVDFDAKTLTLFTKGEAIPDITLQNNVNCIIAKEWDIDTSAQTTKLTLIGNKQVTPKTDLFNGDNSTTEFVLTEIPTDMQVFVGGVEQTLQRENTTVGDYTYSKDQKKITFNTAPPTGTNNIEVVYFFELNLKVNMTADPSLITTYGTRQTKMTKTFLNDYDTMNEFGDNYLGSFATPLASNDVLYPSFDARQFVPGKSIRVVDSIYTIEGEAVDDFYVINSVKRMFPRQNGLIIEVGDKRLSMLNYLKELDDTVTQLTETDDNAQVELETQFLKNTAQVQFDLDVIAIEKRTWDSNAFYWSDDPLDPRSQFRDDGLGPIWYDDGNGYTSEDIDGLEDELITEGGEILLTESGEDLTTEGVSGLINTEGKVTTLFMDNAVNAILPELNSLITHAAVGDDNTVPVESNTTLGNETYREAVFSKILGANSIKVSLRLDVTENNGNTINEIGFFDDASAGNMYSHDLPTPIVKTITNEAFLRVEYIFETVNVNLN